MEMLTRAALGLGSAPFGLRVLRLFVLRWGVVCTCGRMIGGCGDVPFHCRSANIKKINVLKPRCTACTVKAVSCSCCGVPRHQIDFFLTRLLTLFHRSLEFAC